MEELLKEEKDRGNASFKAGNYEQALLFYAAALRGAKQVSNIVMAVTLLCNKAAVLLKMENYQQCIEDCNEALQLQPDAVKALYRRAQAYKATQDLASAYKDLAFLLKLQPSNVDAIALMRLTREAFSHSGTGTTEVGLILSAMMKEQMKTSNSSSSSSSEGSRAEIAQSSNETEDGHPPRNVLVEGMKSLISLCSEEKLHAMDFARRAGTKFIAEFILQQLNNSTTNSSNNNSSNSNSNARTFPLVELAMQLLAACCTHPVFVTACVRAGGAASVWSPSRRAHYTDTAAALTILHRELILTNDGDDDRSSDGKPSSSHPSPVGRTAYVCLSFEGLCLLSTVLVSPNMHNHNVGSITTLPKIAVALLMRILKSFPLSRCDQGPNNTTNNSDTDKPPPPPPTHSLSLILPYLTEISARCLLRGLFAMLKDVSSLSLSLPNNHASSPTSNHDHATLSSVSKTPEKTTAVSVLSVTAVSDRLTIVTDALSVIHSIVPYPTLLTQHLTHYLIHSPTFLTHPLTHHLTPFPTLTHPFHYKLSSQNLPTP